MKVGIIALFKKQPNWLKVVIITGFFVIVSAFIGQIQFCPGKISKAKVKIVDLSIRDDQMSTTIFDIKVRNIGDMPAFIKKAEFQVNKIWEIDRNYLLSPVPVTQTYDAELPNKEIPYKTSINSSQNIDGKDVDRFHIKVGCKDLSLAILLYEVIVRLIYNESNEITECKSVIFILRQPYKHDGAMSFPEDFMWDINQYNKSILEEVVSRNAIISKGVSKLIDDNKRMEQFLINKFKEKERIPS